MSLRHGITWGIACLLSIPLILTAILYGLTASEQGSAWAIARLSALVPQITAVEDFNGRLVDDFSIGKLTVAVDGVNVELSDLRFSWRPRALLKRQFRIERLSVDDLGVRIDAVEKESRAETALSVPDLPLSVSIVDARVSTLGVQLPDQQIALSDLVLAGEWSNSGGKIETFKISYDRQRIAAQVSIARNGNATTDLDFAESRIVWEGEVASTPLQVAVGIAGKLSALDFKLVSTGYLNTNGNGELNLIDQTLPLSIKIRHERLPLDAEQAIEVRRGELTVNGVLNALNIAYSASGESVAKEPIELQVNAVVNGAQNVESGVDSDLEWSIKHPEFPQSLRGETHLVYANERIEISSATQSPYRTRLRGGIGLTALSFDELQFSWDDVQTKTLGELGVFAKSGQLSLDGTLEQAQVVVSGQIHEQRVGDIKWEAFGELSESQLKLVRAQSELLDGEINLHGMVTWRDWVSAQIAITGKRLNVEPLLAGLNSALDLDAEVSVSQKTDDFAGHVKIKSITGIWQGVSFNTRGLISAEGTDKLSGDLTAEVGENSLNLNVSYDEELDGHFRLDMENMSELLPNLAGRLEGSGTIHGSRDAPHLRGELLAYQPRYADFSAQQIELVFDLDPFSTARSELEAIVDGIRHPALDDAVVAANLTATGNIDKHEANVRVDADGVKFTALLGGAWDEKNWLVDVRSIELDEEVVGTWQLEKATSLRFDFTQPAASIRLLKPFCIRRELGNLCIDSFEQRGPNLQTSGLAKDLPIDTVSRFLPRGIKTVGRLNSEFKAAKKETGLEADLIYSVDDGKIYLDYAAGESRKFNVRKFSGNLKINETLGQGLVQLNVDDWLSFDAQGRVPLAEEQPLSVNADGRITDLSLFAEFVPSIAGSDGGFDFSASLSGNKRAPIVKANAELVDGAILISQTGIVVDELTVKAQTTESNEQLLVDLKATPQQGQLNLTATLDLQDRQNWPLELRIEGDKVSAARLPELELDVSPQLSLVHRDQKLSVSGNLGIPLLKYRVNAIPKSAVQVSSDQVLIDSTNKGGEGGVRKGGSWFEDSVAINVDVALGNDVDIKGLGLYAVLGGGVKVTKKYEQGIAANGTIEITQGSFDAYGQSLSIQQGNLLFAGPITNPSLNVITVRNNIPVTAGVKITGTARSPIYSVFSEPPLSDSETLSYIITGRSLKDGSKADAALISEAAIGFGLNQSSLITSQVRDLFALDEFGVETGAALDQTSLVAGKQVTPRISMRTQMNLFTQLWSVFLRYDLTDRWSVEAESGEQQGADIIYGLEYESFDELNPLD